VQSNKGMALFLEVLLMWSRHQLEQALFLSAATRASWSSSRCPGPPNL